MSRCFPVLALAVVLAPAASRAAAEEPRDVYRGSIGGVVWIENFIGTRSTTGTGFLVNRERKLVVTNYHVTNGEETMDVYFPARDSDGTLISRRGYYQENRTRLKELGYYSVGRVVATAPGKDLSIVSVGRVPGSAFEFETASDDPSEDDRLYLLGNPAGRDLWRLGPGVKPEIGTFRGKYSDYPVEMDYKRIRYSVSSFGGNSGGPVLNAAGKVVGVHSSGGGEGGFRGGAVHWSEVDDLLGSVKPHRVFSVENTSNVTVSYQIRWGDGEWGSHKVAARSSWVHWWSGTYKGKPEVRFDSSADTGYQEKKYTVEYYTSYIGRNVKPTVKNDAREYVFRYDKSGVNLDLDLYKK